jgi:predicted Zn-dependent protease
LNWFVGFYALCAGRYDEAATAFRRISELNPSFAGAKTFLATTLLLQGKTAEALEAVEQETYDAAKIHVLPVIYWDLGRKTESDAVLRQLETQFAESSAYQIAQMHAYRGELDLAIAWLERAHRQRDGGLKWMRIDPLLRNLHGERGYQALIEKMKLNGDPPAAAIL